MNSESRNFYSHTTNLEFLYLFLEGHIKCPWGKHHEKCQCKPLFLLKIKRLNTRNSIVLESCQHHTVSVVSFCLRYFKRTSLTWSSEAFVRIACESKDVRLARNPSFWSKATILTILNNNCNILLIFLDACTDVLGVHEKSLHFIIPHGRKLINFKNWNLTWNEDNHRQCD